VPDLPDDDAADVEEPVLPTPSEIEALHLDEPGVWTDEAADELPAAGGGGRSLLAASAAPAVGTMLSRVTGLVRVAALTAALGLTSLADVYNLSNTTPNILYELVLGGVLSATLVPIFTQTNADHDDDTASVLVTVSFVAIAVLTLVAVLLSPAINWVLALPLQGLERRRAVALGDDLLALLLPQILFYGVTTLATAMLNARRKFAAPAFAPILTNLVTAAAALGVYFFVGPARGVAETRSSLWALGLGTTAGVAAMAAVLVPALRRADIRLRWNFQPRHPVVKQVARLSGWTVGFAMANQVALLIVLSYARRLGTGALSTYQYAAIFFQLPYGLIAVSLMTAVLPELATAAKDGDDDAFSAKFREGLSLLLTFMVPAAGAYLLLGAPLVRILLERGAFDAESATQTAKMLAGFSVGLPAFAVFLYVVRAFYARKNTRTPFVLNVVENGINVLLLFPFTVLFGRYGLSVAYSTAYWVAAVLAVFAINLAVPGILTFKTAGLFVRSAVVAVAVILVLVAVYLVTHNWFGPLANLVVGLVVATGTFAAATLVVRPHGFESAVDGLRLGLRRRFGRVRD
jgi:putative peptidoglycan lipid II flippase